jgi:DNA-binding GntR family transcriptional regulator
MAKSSGSGTRADELYERLRADIFMARLKPGQRLKFPDLCAEYGTSVGPAREALTRLTAERLVTLQAHQGYAVTSLSADDLTDLTTARIELEVLAFRRSILSGDDRWESEVVAAHHLLSVRERQAAGGPRGDSWYLAHEAFHAALLAGCGNRRLVQMAQGMRAEAELYRRWAAPLIAEHERNPAAEHQALTDAAISRDAERGVELLRDHIAFTTQMLLSNLMAFDTSQGREKAPAGTPGLRACRPGKRGSAAAVPSQAMHAQPVRPQIRLPDVQPSDRPISDVYLTCHSSGCLLGRPHAAGHATQVESKPTGRW